MNNEVAGDDFWQADFSKSTNKIKDDCVVVRVVYKPITDYDETDNDKSYVDVEGVAEHIQVERTQQDTENVEDDEEMEDADVEGAVEHIQVKWTQ